MKNSITYQYIKATCLFVLLCFILCISSLHAQESCYEQYIREHNMTYLTAEDADDSYDEQKKAVLAKQMFGNRYMLWVDTISGKAQIGRGDGTYIADVHFALVDSTWYMWLSVDPLADKNISNTPYIYCGGNPVMFVDPDGRDSIYVNDIATRPLDRGRPGETYTAEVKVVQNGKIVGSFRGSSYPNSKSETDNSTSWNTIIEGVFPFNNQYGHNGGCEQGLNIGSYMENAETGVQEFVRSVSGIDKNGKPITMINVNVHSGKSDNGNYNSRGSHGCVTIHPEDAASFFSLFNWSNRTRGYSTGRIFINRTGVK